MKVYKRETRFLCWKKRNFSLLKRVKEEEEVELFSNGRGGTQGGGRKEGQSKGQQSLPVLIYLSRDIRGARLCAYAPMHPGTLANPVTLA